MWSIDCSDPSNLPDSSGPKTVNASIVKQRLGTYSFPHASSMRAGNEGALHNSCIAFTRHLRPLPIERCRDAPNSCSYRSAKELGEGLGDVAYPHPTCGLRTRHRGRPEQRGPYEEALTKCSVATTAVSFALADTAASAARN